MKTILARIRDSYDGLYGSTIHGNNQSTCMLKNCPVCDELTRLKSEGLISEFACWGVSTYSITPKGRKPMLKRYGPTIQHEPTGGKPIIVLIASDVLAAQRVLDRLNASGVDWSQPHTKDNHKAMRAAIIAATSDGTVTGEDM